ncbi:hypothetical protein OROMI_010633 [Orobanche minor]
MHNAEFGDYIGQESCADIESDVNAQPPRNRRISRRMEEVETEHPPPIPWLARTGNRPSHMPWVMKRYYTSDGRLILREEKLRHHEYFQAYRSNGRLVMNLVPLHDVVEEFQEEHQGGGGGEEGVVDGFLGNSGDEDFCDPTVGDSVSKCYTYNSSLGLNTCGGFPAVSSEAFRPPVPI